MTSLRPRQLAGDAWLRRLLGVGLLLAGAAVRAQPGSGGPTPVSPTQTPLDGGASLLLAGGVAYALRRLRRPPRPE